jgi:glyoxylase-like metal-dependent hydrolase (beta-lactamase superfamily II)
MAQLKLEQIGDSTWLIPGLVNIGVYVRGGRALLIDSGNDKEAGRQINKLIAEQGWTLECIINTHSNADHIGGNAFLQKKTGCRIAATAGEAPFIRRPELEAAFLYGGFPYPGLDNKFLRAAPSEVTDSIGSSGPISLGGNADGGDTGLEAIPLPGHYFDMIGIRTPDNIVFVADAVFSEYIIEKYHLFYIYDVAGYLRTLDAIAAMDADLFVPSHAKPLGDIQGLLEINRKKVHEIAGVILELCGASFEDVLAGVCGRYGISLDTNQYVLIGSTVRSYLSYLAEKGEIIPDWTGGKMVWKRAG